MFITVGDCLQLDAFSRCNVLSCNNKLNNRVRTVSVLDEDNLDNGVLRNGVKDQMVITHFWNSKDDIDAQIRAVKGLGKSEVAALVVYLNEDGVSKIDERVVSAAESYGLIVVSINDDGKVTYAMLIEQVLDKVLYGNNYSDNILNNTITHLLNFEKHSSFTVALKAAALNNDYQVVLMTEEFNPILTIETRDIVTIDNAIQTARKKDALHHGAFTKLVIDDVVSYWGYINIEEKKYILVIVDNEDEYSATEMKKLAEIIELAIGMWKYTPERDSKSEFIKSAVRGDLSFCYTLLEETGLKGKCFSSIFCIRNIDSDEFFEVLEKFKKNNHFNALILNDGQEIYGIIYVDAGQGRTDEVKFACLDMYDSLKNGKKNVRIFHITGIEKLDMAVEGFKLINKTWNYVQTVFPFKRVFSKYEMTMVYDCANMLTNNSSYKKMYLDLLEPFEREISANKGKLLLETLATFILDASMNSNKTSEFMKVHNNTVQYRLKKVNEILGVDITVNRVVPSLTMALAIKRLEEE